MVTDAVRTPSLPHPRCCSPGYRGLVAGVIVAAFIGAAIGKGIVKKHLAA